LLGDQRDRREIGRGIVADGCERLVLSMTAGVAEHELMPSGAAFATRWAPIMPAAADVLDDHLLAQDFRGGD
jgi:hypothetical protein